MEILVSVNCITYNHEKYISQCIEGFLMQKTNFDFEILIGEDCSTDNTRSIIEAYVKKYPNKIRLISSENNVGFMKNSIRVFEQSKGKYIAICEGDDYWIDENKLQQQVDYMEKNLECSLCCHNSQILDDETKKEIGLFKQENTNKKYMISDIILGGGGFLSTPSLIFRREIIENLPQWYKNSSVGDYPLQLIASTFGYIYYMKDVMSVYRTNVNGSWTKENQINASKEKIIKNYRNVIDILSNFNEYSYFKYTYEVNKVIIPLEFEICILSGRVKDIRNPRYKECYDDLDVNKKVKTYIKAICPSAYMKLIDIKTKLKKGY